ncbi:MAG: multicopper oxidase family protein [Pseudomonadota bacterium]
MDRRKFLKTAGATAAATLAGTWAMTAAASRPTPVQLRIQTARYRLGESITDGMVSLSPNAPPPILRLKQGSPFAADVVNTLSDATAMHWHGIRLPNRMDGVPYLTQWPIMQGETWRYEFTSQDAGTYWYHPHCMTMEQMARGLTGILIVEEREDPGFDSETVLNLRDFRLGKDDQFTKLYSARKAARGGTLGNVMTANWEQNPVYTHLAGSLVRLRLAATDTTRIYQITIDGAAGRILAMDGHPIREPVPWPSEEQPLVLGPGQRSDIAIVMPAQEGREVVIAHRGGGRVRALARLRSVGSDQRRSLRDLSPLAANKVPNFDPKTAQKIDLVIGWSPDGTKPNNGFCGSVGPNFWAINRTAWPGDAAKETGAIAKLTLGQSYVMRLRNESPNTHPIHIHGLVFRPLRSNQRTLPSNWTDTIVVRKNEIIDIGFVADNPGDWALHCHVIEHQKTGLAGYIRVA